MLITRDGKHVAVLLAPVDDDDLERLLLSRSRRFQQLLKKSRKSIRPGRGLSEEDVWLAVDARAAQRAGNGKRTRGKATG
jgi:hypothetical protein